jgi:hypothetical protein
MLEDPGAHIMRQVSKRPGTEMNGKNILFVKVQEFT